jgi:hypothetical protein
MRTGWWSDYVVLARIVKFDLPEFQETTWIRWQTEVDLNLEAYCWAADKGYIAICCIYTAKAPIDVEDEEPPYAYEYKVAPPCYSFSKGYGSNDNTMPYGWFSNTYHIEGTLVVPEESVTRVYIGYRVYLFQKSAGRSEIFDGEFRVCHLWYTSYPYPF